MERDLQDLRDFCRRQGEYIHRKRSKRYHVKIYQIKQPRTRQSPKGKRFTRFIDFCRRQGEYILREQHKRYHIKIYQINNISRSRRI